MKLIRLSLVSRITDSLSFRHRKSICKGFDLIKFLNYRSFLTGLQRIFKKLYFAFSEKLF